MAFADELRNVQPKGQNSSMEAEIRALQNTVREYCMGCAWDGKQSAQGYILRRIGSDDAEHPYAAAAELYPTLPRELAEWQKVQATYPQKRAAMNQVFPAEKAVMTKNLSKGFLDLIAGGRKQLEEDGIQVVQLEPMLCKKVVYVVKEEKTFLKKDYYRERVETNEPAGYVIRFKVCW